MRIASSKFKGPMPVISAVVKGWSKTHLRNFVQLSCIILLLALIEVGEYLKKDPSSHIQPILG